MNISKISRINNNTSMTHHLKENQHNKSQLQPYSSIPQLVVNPPSQFGVNKNNNSLNSFTQPGNASSVDNYNQLQGQNNNLITSNNNSFISGL